MPATVLRRLALGLLLVVFLVGVWTAGALLLSRDDLLEAKQALELAREADDVDTLRERLSEAEERLRRTSSRLSSPGPELAAAVPVLGRTPEAVRRTSDATLAAVVSAQAVLDVVGGEPPLLADARVDLDRLSALAAQLRRSAEVLGPQVERLDDVDTGLVPGAVRDAVHEAQRTLTGVPAALTAGADAVDALQSLAGRDGPRRLLVVLQNNAELRGTGGLVSVFAEATLTDGRLELGSFRDVEGVADTPEQVRRVPAPPDYQALFGPLLADSTLWRNTNADPDVPTSSAVLAEVARTSLGVAPDAVLWLDVPALAAVLEGTSPAELPDGTVLTSENAVEFLLSDAYEAVADDGQAQALRRARLRATADLVVSRLLEGNPDASRLGTSLGRAAAARHLALWSADAQEQQAWRRAGLAGHVAPDDRGIRGGPAGDLAAFTVHNLGAGDDAGNKLDYYARREMRVRVRVERDTAHVEREVILHNLSPTDGLPRYVIGDVEPGTTNNLVTHTLPPDAESEELLRGEHVLLAEPRQLGDTLVLVDAVSLPPGTSATWRLRYQLPLRDGRYALRLVPQPLAVDGDLEVVLTPGDDVELRQGSDGLLHRDSESDGLALRERHGPVREVVVEAAEPDFGSRLRSAVRRFWDEPVSVPW